MNKTSTTIVFFGNERLATGVQTTAPTLRALVEQGYNVRALVANHEMGQSRSARELEIASVAKAYHIPLLLPDKPSSILKDLKSVQADIGVLVAYGKIIPDSVINLFPKGIINIHPSLLPLHRGPTPIESVILNGETETGVSIMQLAHDMDAGPVYGQSVITLHGNESKQTLADKLLETGAGMLIELLPEILSGSVVALPQDNARATYDSLIRKAAGLIDWHKPAVQIEREIRAYLEWPKSRTEIGSIDTVITHAKVVPHTGIPGTVTMHNKELVVACGQDSLMITKLKPAGKNEMTAEAFLAGYRQ